MPNKIKSFLSRPMNVLMTVLFVLIFIMNLLVVPTADDLAYKINDGLIDIFYREYIQYMTWTGRSVAHIIARIFLALPKIIFDICNTFCFVYLTYLIYVHATGTKEKNKPLLYAIVILLVFLFVPLFGQTVLWETGSCNYLWTTTIIMQFLLMYRLDRKDRNIFLVLLFGIIAGWTNENTGGALILMIIFILCFKKYKKENIQTWMYSGLVGSIIGFVMMVIAPGNKIRSADFVSEKGKMYDLMHDFYGFLEVLEEGQIVLLVIIIIGIFLGLYLKKRKEDITYSIFYAICGIAAVFAIILSPVPVLFDRSMFGSTIFLIISATLLINILFEKEYIKVISICGMAIMVLISSFNYIQALFDLAYIRYQYTKREAYVENEKQKGNLNPTIFELYNEFMTSYNPYYDLGDITPYRLLSVNKDYATVHGLESVQSTPLDKWNQVYASGDSYLMNIIEFDEYVDAVSSQDKYIVLVNSSYLDESKYSSYKEGLTKLGFDDFSSYITGVSNKGILINSSISNENGVYLDGNINEHYYYISSSDDETLSDILVDNIEYTNDRPGISLIVFDEEENKVVDAVTWTYDSDQGGTRYYIEK